MAGSIFERQPPLKPSTMAAVAERRFDDAAALCATGENARANGAAYLLGFVIEILLKARLVEKYPSIAKKQHHQVSQAERELWRLIWKQHDLDVMLTHLPEVQAALKKRGRRDGVDYLKDLKEICAGWTILARYSSRSMLFDDARQMLDRVRGLKELLK